jgi:hypothetical protein
MNNNQTPRRPVPYLMRTLLLLPAVGAFLALSSCREEAAPPPAPIIVETEPVGNGLAVIGFAMIGAAVVIVLGRLLR